jgi:hypothetical protein
MLQTICEMHGRINVIFVTNGYPKWFHIVQKIHQNQKGKYSKFRGFILDCIRKMTERRWEHKRNESATSTQLPFRSLSVTNLVNHLQDGFEICKMVYVPLSKIKKLGAMKKRRVCKAHKRRKGTIGKCWCCGVAFCKTPVLVNISWRNITEQALTKVWYYST